MKHFKKLTLTPPSPGLVNAVVMGRKTFDSLPRPLPGRTNVVLTTQGEDAFHLPEGVVRATSLKDATDQLSHRSNLGHVFCIGGASLYQQAVEEGYVNRIVYTQVSNLPSDQKFDTFFPELDETDWECRPFGTDQESTSDAKENDQPKTTENTAATKPLGPTIAMVEYHRRPNLEEQQYLDLCRDILDTGIQRGDRTGTGTLSKFGAQMRFNLRNGRLPLLTTKRTFWRGVAEELLWFISVGGRSIEWMLVVRRVGLGNAGPLTHV